MAIREFFPTQIYTAQMSAAKAKKLNAHLKREANLFREQDDVGKKWSRDNYDSGYTSYSSIADLPFRSSQFDQLKKWIDIHAQKFAKHLELDLDQGRLEMGTCWINIMGNHCHHSYHVHPLSVLSGTYYVDVPPGSGTLKFEDPRMDSFMGSPPRKGKGVGKAKVSNRRHIELLPKSAKLVLFESWLRHEVPAQRFKSETHERISVSFNYDWQL